MDMLQPIMVRTFGRTGSTLLMQLLGTSERIFFERVYPFEHRYLTYVHNMSRVAGSPTVDDTMWNNDIMFQGKSNCVGALPYGLIRSLDRKLLQQQTFVALWQAFSENIRKQTGLVSGPGWYAEKAPEEVATMAVAHLNAKSIYLLRDPRDEMISIKSFNNKRGFNSFGWQDTDTDAVYATRLCANRRKFMQKLISSETTRNEIHVRYEDLILKGKHEAARLAEWLGTPMNIKTAMKDKSVISRHMTSKNPESSVARWKHEMDDDIKAIFRKQLGAELQELGYEL